MSRIINKLKEIFKEENDYVELPWEDFLSILSKHYKEIYDCMYALDYHKNKYMGYAGGLTPKTLNHIKKNPEEEEAEAQRLKEEFHKAYPEFKNYDLMK